VSTSTLADLETFGHVGARCIARCPRRCVRGVEFESLSQTLYIMELSVPRGKVREGWITQPGKPQCRRCEERPRKRLRLQL
jgi:hypothetical protein